MLLQFSSPPTTLVVDATEAAALHVFSATVLAARACGCEGYPALFSSVRAGLPVRPLSIYAACLQTNATMTYF